MPKQRESNIFKLFYVVNNNIRNIITKIRKLKQCLRFMKSFKISNLVTKTLFSSEKTKKLIDGGVQIRAGSSEIILSKNERAGWGG